MAILFHVDRRLIRACAGHLKGLTAWQARPLRALIRLIYCLNTIDERFPLTRYRAGVRQPAQTIRELKGVAGLCRRANNARATSRLVARLQDLKKEDSDALHILRFNVAGAIHPRHPEAALGEEGFTESFLAFAAKRPLRLAELCEAAISSLEQKVSPGRGGARRKPAPEKRYVIEELGLYYEWLTGRRPAATFDPHRSDSGYPRESVSTHAYKGPFISLCREVLEELGHPMNERRVFDALRSIDIERWQSERRAFGKRQD